MTELATPLPTTTTPSRRLPNTSTTSPRTHLIGIAAAFAGISLVVNLTRFLLVYFYLPPDTAALPQVIDNTTFFGVFNVVALVASLGRAFDAFLDPLVALWCDRAKRRVPVMTVAALPVASATLLLFTTPTANSSGANIAWLIAFQTVTLLATTVYATPLFALVTDISSGAGRTQMSSVAGAAWSIGIVGAAMTPFAADLLQHVGATPLGSWRLAVGLAAAVGMVFMLVPRFTILESPQPTQPRASIREALDSVLASRHVRPYLAAEAAYSCGLATVQTGLLYYLTILVHLPRTAAGWLMLMMIGLSVPLQLGPVPRIASASTKRLYLLAFAVAIVDFTAIFFLGHLPGPSWAQACVVIGVLAFPFSVFGGLSTGLLADIAEASNRTSGTRHTAMFVAARTFVQKVSQAVGLGLFALLTTFGRTVDDDLGLRLSGLAGAALFLLAAVAFNSLDENRLRRELGRGA